MTTQDKHSRARLGEFASSGGCGCKIGAGVLREWLAPINNIAANGSGGLIVGGEFCDDAAVWQTDSENAVVASVDFFAPVVDDPEDFGAIAAANALSDIYAMGATPQFALALAAMPKVVGGDIVRAILNGGAKLCARANVVVGGGHSIECAEPLYGLCAIGAAHPQKILTNGGAQAGDKLILGKPLGVGLMSAAHRKGELSESEYGLMTASMKTINSAGAQLAKLKGAHAMTDVTGFGLLGHLLEMCRASGLTCVVNFGELPVFEEAARLAKAGNKTGGGKRNKQDCKSEVIFDGDEWQLEILTDPQTSGGLLLACAPESVGEAIAVFNEHNCANAKVIGEFCAADAKTNARITVIARD